MKSYIIPQIHLSLNISVDYNQFFCQITNNFPYRKLFSYLKWVVYFRHAVLVYLAIALVTYIYKSWFALQKHRQRKIEGKERWLNMLKSDLELEQESDSSLEVIHTKANEILANFAVTHGDSTNQNSKDKKYK